MSDKEIELLGEAGKMRREKERATDLQSVPRNPQRYVHNRLLQWSRESPN